LGIIFIWGCSEGPETSTNTEKHSKERQATELSLEQANKELEKLFPFVGKIVEDDGVVIVTVTNKLPGKTVYTSGILEAIYKATEVYCRTNIQKPKVELEVKYNLNGTVNKLFEAETYREPLCNAVKAAQKAPDKMKGAIVLNNLRSAEIEVGNRSWFNEFCKDQRINMFCRAVKEE